MITEDYCSFEVAKLLKEKGFEGICDYAYSNKGNYFEIDRSNFDEVYCLRPTHQMAMAWLRKKGLHINITYKNRPMSTFLYYWSIAEHEDIKGLEQTYKEAVEESLKYCLQNLI